MASRVWEIALPLVCFIAYVVFATQLAVEQSPDESMRLLVPFYIFDAGVLPIGPEPEIMNDIWGFSYAFTPYGPSLLSVFFMHVASWFGADLAGLVVAARIPSCIAGALTVFVCIRIGRRLFHNNATAVLLGVLVGFLPQFVFLSAYLNNDSGSSLACAIVFLAWVWAAQEGWNLKNSILLGFGLGACAMTYYFGYGFIPCSIVAFFAIYLRNEKQPNRSTKNMFCLAGVVFLVAMVIGGWFFVRSAIIYQGDLFGMSTRAALAKASAAPGFAPGEHLTPKLAGMSPFAMLFSEFDGQIWVDATTRSFFGVFGYMEWFLPNALYCCYAVTVIFAIAGLFAFRRFKLGKNNLLVFVLMIVCMVLPSALTVYYSWSTDYQSQGRYLYSLMPSFMILVAAGVEAFGGFIARVRSKGKGSSQSVEAYRASSTAAVVVLVVLVLYAILSVAALMIAFVPNCLYGVNPPTSYLSTFHLAK